MCLTQLGWTRPSGSLALRHSHVQLTRGTQGSAWMFLLLPLLAVLSCTARIAVILWHIFMGYFLQVLYQDLRVSGTRRLHRWLYEGTRWTSPSCIPCQLNCCRTCRESSCTVCLPSVPPLTTFGLRSQCQTNSMMKQRPQRGLFCDSWQPAEKNDFTQEKGLNPSAMYLGIETNIGRFCSSQSSLPCVSLPALLARHSHATLPHVRKKKHTAWTRGLGCWGFLLDTSQDPLSKSSG